MIYNKQNKKGFIGRQISFVVIGDALTTLSLLVSGMLLARLLSRPEMGTYRQIQYLVLFSASLAELGLSTTVYRYWVNLSKTQRVAYLRMLFQISVVSCSLAAIALYIMSDQISSIYRNPELAQLMIVASIVPFSAVLIQFVRPILISEGYSFRATFLQMFFEVVPIAAIVVPVLMNYSLKFAVVSWAVFSSLRLAVLPIVLRDYIFSYRGSWWDRDLFQKMWSYVWPIQISRVPGLITANLDKVIMSVYFPPQRFAVYSIGAREIPFVSGIGTSVSSVLIPHMSSDWNTGNTERLCLRWKLACLRTALLTYPIAALCAYHSTAIVTLLFSSKYFDSGGVFRIFSMIAFVRIVEYASLAKAVDQTRPIMIAAVISNISFVVFGFSLTWRFGMVGMALAVLLSFVVSGGYFLLFYRSFFKTPINKIFPLSSLGIVAAVAFASVFFVDWMFGDLDAETIVGNPITLSLKLFRNGVAAGIAYLTVLALVGYFVKELSWFRDFVRSFLSGVGNYSRR